MKTKYENLSHCEKECADFIIEVGADYGVTYDKLTEDEFRSLTLVIEDAAIAWERTETGDLDGFFFDDTPRTIEAIQRGYVVSMMELLNLID